MRLPFVFILLLFALTTGEDNSTSTTAPDIKFNKLCLYLNNLTLNNIKFKSPQLKWVQTEGIFYVYDAVDSMDTFKSLKFPIFAQKPSESDVSTTTFTFIGDESMVGCWIEPDFNQLNIRFKLYEFYHIAFKAVSMISIPPIYDSDHDQTSSTVLDTLPYQHADANAIADITLSWLKQPIALSPPISPIGPPIPPAQPPIDAYYANMDTFDSDEITEHIITADKDGMRMDPDIETSQEIAGPSTNWMFIAALCSSMLGLFILVYICLWGYKTYGRQEYKSIPSLNKSSNMSDKLGGIRKISLRNIGINNDNEQKGIIHPCASYTFDD